MTGMATTQAAALAEALVSEETAQSITPIRRLLQIGWEIGFSTSLTESENAFPATAAAERFEMLARKWREECAHLSAVREMVLHPAYQQIIGMGKDAIPFLLRELERQPDHWFWALWAITQENPVRPEHQGRVRKMAQDWLEWAKQEGIQW